MLKIQACLKQINFAASDILHHEVLVCCHTKKPGKQHLKK